MTETTLSHAPASASPPAGDATAASCHRTTPLETTVADAARAAERHPAAGGVVAVEDVQSRQEQKSQALFAGRVKVYPKAVQGAVRRWKWIGLIVLLGIYYLTPWLRWDRGPGAPDQAVLVDMDGRRAYFFAIEIWPQEVYYVTGLLILGALGLFLVSSLFGRIWCGFACPQTVWTDLFMWVERRIEGDRNARMRLDKGPITVDRVTRKVSKHGAWLVIALATGGAWIMYFQNAPTFLAEFFTLQSSGGTYFFVGLFTATTYLLGGIAREQVCTYMCPWPRFQAALLDEDSLVVAYRHWRGEPRGKHKKGTSWEGRGDCVDCKQCVAVCPTGIDIRDGIQLECIGCGLCIDACDAVMDKVGRPRGLVAFDSERNQKRAAAGQPPVRFTFFRMRTYVYLAVMALVAGLMLATFGNRASFDLNIIHDRNPLYVTLSDGSIRNGYQIKLINKTYEDRLYRVRVEGIASAHYQVLGRGEAGDEGIELPAARDGVTTYQLYLSTPAGALEDDSTPLRFVVTDLTTQDVLVQNDVFRGPDR